MEETLEQKKRRLFGKQYISDYIEIIKKITIYKKNDEVKILSIVDTDAVINKASLLEATSHITIAFNNKEELIRIITEKCTDTENLYLYTNLSQDCGLVFLNSIQDFNFNFNFEDEPVGLIILIGIKSNYKIVLDFYEEDYEKIIEIEHYG